MTAPSLQDRLRDRIAQAIESVAHDPGGRPCELCVETADAVLAVLADAERCVPAFLDAQARPTDDLWASVWRRLGTARPRTGETPDAG